MMAGSKISCMGIVGDGCGGGREFVIEDDELFAYDPQSSQKIILLEEVYDAISISKDGCILFIECKDKSFEFDLSLMKVV